MTPNPSSRRRVLLATCLLAVGATACARPASAPRGGTEVMLVGADGQRLATDSVLKGADWTVLVFLSRVCPCVEAHDARLRQLAVDFAPRGVRFFAIDAEVGGTPEVAADEARQRQYPFPILLDEGARLADQLGAEYATFTVILSRAGEIVYRGGIDSDKQKLHDDARMYLREVLDDLTAGRPPRTTETNALGCVLRKG